jgi:hypothetical protein
MKATHLLFLVLLVTHSNAQNVTFTKVWEKVYGGLNEEQSYNYNLLQLDKDSNIVIAASSRSDIGGNKTSPICAGTIPFSSDFWLIKLDQNGNKIFDNSYGSSEHEFLGDAILLADGSIILVGQSESPITCSKSQNRFSSNPDIWLIKVDSNGVKLWDKRYGPLIPMGLVKSFKHPIVVF